MRVEPGQTVIVSNRNAGRLSKAEVERVLPTGKVVISGKHYDLSTREKCGRGGAEIMLFDEEVWARLGTLHWLFRAVARWPQNFPWDARHQLDSIWDATVRELRVNSKQKD